MVRAAARGTTPGFSTLISSKLKLDSSPADGVASGPSHSGGGGYLPVNEDARLSRSLLRGLSILTCFGADNSERGIIDMASQLEMSPSTTHRYVSTLVELGLLERSPRTRKYRLALAPGEGSTSPKPSENARTKPKRRAKART